MTKTLLQMAGADIRPHSLADAAVLVIDAQCEYVTGGVPLPGVEAALAEAKRVVEAARKAGRPVIHIMHKGRSGGLFAPDGPGFPIADAVAPQDGETVLEKALPNSFTGTGLAEVIKDKEITGLIVCGFMTHMCVSSTVRAAVDHGLFCTVVAQACATRDLPDGKGGVVAAADVQRAELAALGDRFAAIAQTVDDL
ncbi:MAG: cysteine hydrolase, partial [Rhodospirillales bacterium]|nr:cysteine hydrolase [Rhodospirillales bacterium]